MTPAIQLRSGAYLDFRDPGAQKIAITDIAHALGNLCRFTGHAHRFYSVAEHSVLATLLVPRADAFAALMHDAAEAFVGDVAKPLKILLPDYQRIEAMVHDAIMDQFGLPRDMPESVKRADRIMLAVEQRHAMLSRDDWQDMATIPTDAPRLQFWTPRQAQDAFLTTFNSLQRTRHERASA